MSESKEQNEAPNRKGRASKPAPSVNMEELRELIGLLRENGLAELELENEGFRVRLRRESAVSEPAHHAAAPPPPAPAPAAPSPAPLHRIGQGLVHLVRRRRQRLHRIRTYTLFRRRLWARSIVRRLRRPIHL